MSISPPAEKGWTCSERALVITTGVIAVTSFTALSLIHFLNRGKAVHVHRGLFPASTLGLGVVSSLVCLGGIAVSSIRAEKRKKAFLLQKEIRTPPPYRESFHQLHPEANRDHTADETPNPHQELPSILDEKPDTPYSSCTNSLLNTPLPSSSISLLSEAEQSSDIPELDSEQLLRNASERITSAQAELCNFVDTMLPDDQNILLPDFAKMLMEQIKPDFNELKKFHAHLEEVIQKKGNLSEEGGLKNCLSQEKLASISDLKTSLEKIFQENEISTTHYKKFLEKLLPFCEEVFSFIPFLACKYDRSLENIPWLKNRLINIFLSYKHSDNLPKWLIQKVKSDIVNKKFNRYFPIFAKTTIPETYAEFLLELAFHLGFYKDQKEERAIEYKEYFRSYAHKKEIKPSNVDTLNYFDILKTFNTQFSSFQPYCDQNN